MLTLRIPSCASVASPRERARALPARRLSPRGRRGRSVRYGRVLLLAQGARPLRRALVTGDKCTGMLGALEEVFPGARCQRCTVHFYRNVLGRVPVTRR